MSTVVPAQPLTEPLAELVRDSYTVDNVGHLIDFLKAQGTFEFPTFNNGLFSAALSVADGFAQTGYQSVWVRDNVHVAHAHGVWGDVDAEVRVAESIMTFYVKTRHRFADVIEGRVDPHDFSKVNGRPHIRFDGEHLKEKSEKWAHAQNDALGLFLWSYCRLVAAGAIEPTPAAWGVLSDFPAYFEAIPYWRDEDSGHWEERRKIEASSIGLVVAGLRGLKKIWAGCPAHTPGMRPYSAEKLDRLIDAGEGALNEILPHECRQDEPLTRRYDSALLFLLFPAEVVGDEMGRRIVDDVRVNLMGSWGIKRYVGDSYWCADYKKHLSIELRTSDFSDGGLDRDALLVEGLEAQWCLFDPLISIIAGRWYAKTRDPQDLALQVEHLNRSLRQLTPPGSEHGAYKCPESYYMEDGHYRPNDITPLLWTQANLRMALEFMKRSACLVAGVEGR